MNRILQLLGTLALLLAHAAMAQTTVRFASVGGVTDAGVYIADELGYFRESNITIDVQRMANAPALTAAIATNQIDIAGISVSPGLYTSVQQGMNLRIVGDKQSMRPGFAATRLVVRKDLAQKDLRATMQALKGKRVAVSAKASISYYLLHRLLHKYGVNPNDVQAIELAYPNMLAALSSGAVEAAINLEPFLSQSVKAGVVVVASDLIEVMPVESATVVPLVYSENFAKNRAVAQAFMTAYIKGVRVYNDAFIKNKDKDKVVDIIARRAKVDAATVRDTFVAGLDPNQKVGAAELEAYQKFFVEMNLIRNPIDVRRIVDSSFVDNALIQLGPYK